MSDALSGTAADTPETQHTADRETSAGHGRHRGPAAESEEAQPRPPAQGRHRRTTGDDRPD